MSDTFSYALVMDTWGKASNGCSVSLPTIAGPVRLRADGNELVEIDVELRQSIRFVVSP
jgi:hypothetical protein